MAHVELRYASRDDAVRYVQASLGREVGGFDVEAIVDDFLGVHDTYCLDTVGHDAYWAVIRAHQTTEV